ncbi:PREDICTED: heparanase-like [Habropoda laboriosa]|uniref:heparanase-like n=1 Tax=Habropoda laboriosa TaxID=597456 RepID=UPI00083CB944|nr:PREDICTED: heparanase-like [Habropoda laboriosa]
MSYFITNNQGKNQYGRLDEVRTQSRIYPAFSLTIVGFCVIFLLLLAWNLNNTTNQTVNTRVIYLNSRHLLLRTVSNKFLSFGLDTSLLRDMKNFPIKSSKFINLARHLAPAYAQIISEKIISPVDDADISNFTINDIDFENIYNFATKAKLRMIFDINVLIRTVNGSWDDTNAKDIILFAKNKNMKLDWQLGNEPNSFNHVFNITITATQLANDYYKLRQLLNKMGYSESILVGPEVNHVGDIKHMGEHYAETFLQNNKNSVDYVTWHQYYLNGRETKLEDFINVSTFNLLPMQIKSMNEAIQLSGKPMWLSETSTAYGGGAPKLSDRFVAGFLWLDKLGYSATAGVNVVTRQSLLGGYYAMIGPDIMANPDWWISVIYKQFVSEKVLQLSSTDRSSLRFYAHCTPKNALIDNIPAITIYGVNIDKLAIPIIIEGIPVYHKNAKVYLYALTSDSLQSRSIQLNGKILQLLPNGNLPPFQPIVLEPTQLITLPPYSMVFIVVHGAKVPVCNV